MKIIGSADWHLDAMHAGRLDPSVGMHSTWVESFGRLNDIVELCNDEEADLLMVSGDVYDTGRPTAEAVGMTLDRLRKLRKTKVVFVNGNHDQQSVLMDHRTPIDAYLAGQPFTLHVASVPEVIEVDGIALALMPWLKVAGVSQAELADRDLADTLKRMGDVIGDRPALLAGHIVVNECTFDSGRRGSEVLSSNAVLEASVPTSLLDSLPTERNLLGHIHLSQELSEKTRYLGSTYKVDFGEYGHEKGVEIIEITGRGQSTHRWHPLPGRELWNLDATKTDRRGDLLPLDLFDLGDRARPGDRVKLQLDWDEDNDPAGLNEYLKTLRKKGVVYETPRKTKPRQDGGRRITGLATNASPLEALKVYMDQQKVGAEERDALLSEFAELLA